MLGRTHTVTWKKTGERFLHECFQSWEKTGGIFLYISTVRPVLKALRPCTQWSRCTTLVYWTVTIHATDWEHQPCTTRSPSTERGDDPLAFSSTSKKSHSDGARLYLSFECCHSGNLLNHILHFMAGKSRCILVWSSVRKFMTILWAPILQVLRQATRPCTKQLLRCLLRNWRTPLSLPPVYGVLFKPSNSGLRLKQHPTLHFLSPRFVECSVCIPVVAINTTGGYCHVLLPNRFCAVISGAIFQTE